jgi:hypothetical protein
MSDDSGQKVPLSSDLGDGPIDEDELFSGKEAGQDDEIGFEDDFGIEAASENEGTKAATKGVSVLGQGDTAYSLTDDSLGETAEVRLEGDKELGEEHSLDEDVSLESFGSGSGLLDLSLQADDTSLGAVLDDIIPVVGGGGAGAEPGGFDGGMDISEDVLSSGDEQAQVPSEPASSGFGESTSNIGQVSVAAMAYIEPAPDASSNMFGAMLVIPFVVLVYTIIISTAGALGISPNLLGSTQDIIWYIGGGLVFVALIMMFIGAAAGGSKGGPAKTATAKVAAPKKVKPAKPVKAKKK